MKLKMFIPIIFIFLFSCSCKSPGNEEIRSAMSQYVENEAANTGGNFEVMDMDLNKIRRLKMKRVHERVGKTGDYFYSCADFEDLDSGELLDLDIDVALKGKKLEVSDVRIHKVSGNARYTYDENDNRIPLVETKSHIGKDGKGKEHGGEEEKEHGGQEHGGKEHGGG